MTAINPIFLHLMTQFEELHNTGQGHSEAAANLFSEALNYAPDGFKKALRAKAIELDLMPATPDGYSDDGEPLYILDDACKRLGIAPADVPAEVLAHAHTGTFHRAH